MGTTWITIIEGERWDLLMAGKELEYVVKVGKERALIHLSYGKESGLYFEVNQIESL